MSEVNTPNQNLTRRDFLKLTWAVFGGLAGSTLLPRPGDYDGDGKCDPAVYAPGQNSYRVWPSGSGYSPVVFSW